MATTRYRTSSGSTTNGGSGKGPGGGLSYFSSYLSILVAVFAICGVGYTVVSKLSIIDTDVTRMGPRLIAIEKRMDEMGAAINTLNQKVSLNEVTNAGQSSTIAEYRVTLNQLADRNVLLRNDVIGLTAGLTEIETQFCSEDLIRNQQTAYFDRMIGIMWFKVYQQEFPISNAFHAQIGRCKNGGSTILR